jgi:hypothetical protein
MTGRRLFQVSEVPQREREKERKIPIAPCISN